MLYARVLLSCCLVILSDALNCSVTGESGRTTYVISDWPPDSAGCWDYTWSNSTNHVIANNRQEIGGLVLKNTNTTLHTSKFIEGIIFTGFIAATGDLYTARCPITNTENAHSEFSRYNFPTVAVVVPPLLSVLLLVVLLYIFRDKIPSCSSRNSSGCMYTAAKTAGPGV
ncbi:uncharacterized protein AB9X84_022647 isoform 2-T2 [Acanthopagrus schlegelii]